MYPLSKYSAILILDAWAADLRDAATDRLTPQVVHAITCCVFALRVPTADTEAMRHDAAYKALLALHEYREATARRWGSRALALDLVIAGELRPEHTADAVKAEAEQLGICDAL